MDEVLAISKAATSAAAAASTRMSGSSTDENDSGGSKVIGVNNERNDLSMTLRGTCEADLASEYDVSGRMKKAISLGRDDIQCCPEIHSNDYM